MTNYLTKPNARRQRRIKNAKDNLDKITRDQKYLKSDIEQNNLRFLEDGTYVTYFLDYRNIK